MCWTFKILVGYPADTTAKWWWSLPQGNFNWLQKRVLVSKAYYSLSELKSSLWYRSKTKHNRSNFGTVAKQNTKNQSSNCRALLGSIIFITGTKVGGGKGLLGRKVTQRMGLVWVITEMSCGFRKIYIKLSYNINYIDNKLIFRAKVNDLGSLKIKL